VFSPLDRIDPYGIKSDARPLLVYTLQDLKDYGRMGSESMLTETEVTGEPIAFRRPPDH